MCVQENTVKAQRVLENLKPLIRWLKHKTRNLPARIFTKIKIRLADARRKSKIKQNKPSLEQWLEQHWTGALQQLESKPGADP
jgi:hypothetical protein